MARFDDLPADQKAVLQLVLRQGRTYAEIATLLKISDAAVQNRARASSNPGSSRIRSGTTPR